MWGEPGRCGDEADRGVHEVIAKEQEFYNALRDVFVGAKVEGRGGFINLMQIKSGYYDKIKSCLRRDIDVALMDHSGFREDLFIHLYSFFTRYFTQNGSIYFNDTVFHNNVYEKVYTNEKDVVLFWKTQMLYYVKTDNLYRSMPVEFDGLKFLFDASTLENKAANEKKDLVFTLADDVGEKGEDVIFKVTFAKNGIKTKTDAILREIKKRKVSITPEQLEKAFRVFRRQSEVDYFINKNAESFLKEQFKLWSYQYFWDGAKEWGAERVNELQILKNISYKIIDFIAQFEDELVKIWNKPKFVKNSNYVITLDRLPSALVKKVMQANGYKEQVKEWAGLGIDEKNPKAPIDTKYFKGLELDILSTFDDLDKALDGWLIKSENYQALNTILPKFKEKVQCIYIDPPFNTGTDFEFIDKFQDSTWLTLMSDRLAVSKGLLAEDGYIYLQLDHYADYLGRLLLLKIFSDISIDKQSIITWNTGDNISGFKTQRNNWIRQADKILVFPNSSSSESFVKLWSPVEGKKDRKIGWLDFIGHDKNNLYIEKWHDGKLEQEPVNVHSKRIGTIWNDIYSFQYSEPRETESFSFANQKPENLLRRIIQSCSSPEDIILDFFVGIGTTSAVAQKLNRRWIVVDCGDHLDNFYIDKDGEKKVGSLGRMKIVLSGDSKFSLPNTTEERNPHLSKDVNWQGGGFFKYYELEQYEESLARCKYEDGDLFTQSNKSSYEQYVFLPDEKMLKVIEQDYKNNKIKVDVTKLYENVDVAETLSNLTGKWIKAIRKDDVEFTDGSSVNTKDLDYKLIKPLIWWE